MVSGRQNGLFGDKDGETEDTIEQLKGRRYGGSYQLDLLTTTLGEQAKYESLIAISLRQSSDLHSNEAFQLSSIPIYDFSQPVLGETDLRINYKSWADVASVNMPRTDKGGQVHQTSFTINFWSDYIVGKEYSRVDSIDVNVDQIEE